MKREELINLCADKNIKCRRNHSDEQIRQLLEQNRILIRTYNQEEIGNELVTVVTPVVTVVTPVVTENINIYRFSQQIYGEGDSFYISDILTKYNLDKEEIRKCIEEEIEKYYVARELMTFKIYGKKLELPRDKAFFGDNINGKHPLYRYGAKYYPAVNDWTPTLSKLLNIIQLETGQICNHLVANRYKNGKDHIGFHRDKIRDLWKILV